MECSYLNRPHTVSTSSPSGGSSSDADSTSSSAVLRVDQKEALPSQIIWPTIWPGKATPPILGDTGAFTSRYDLLILHQLNRGTVGPSLVSIHREAALEAYQSCNGPTMVLTQC